MTALQLSENIGKTVEYHGDKLTFGVTIVDARISYGNLQYKIEPTNGHGSSWVSDARLKL